RLRPARPHDQSAPNAKKMQEGVRRNRKTLLHELVTPGRIETAAVAYCWGELVLPIFVPITSPEIMISTRRFCWRPAGVSLLATGFDFPNPVAVIEFGSSPCVIKYARTVLARCSESVWLNA